MKKRWFAAAMAAVTVFALTAGFAACGDDSGSGDSSSTDTGTTSETVTTYYTVDFESNGGSDVEAQSVAEGDYATKPDDPTKDGYVFGDWYDSSELDTIFEFDETPITADTTLYASWVDESASDTCTATFYWNYDGAEEEVYATKTFTSGSRFSAPDDPDRGDEYFFAGWYDADGTAFSSMKKYEGDQSFYASWQTIYTFEAEDTQLTELYDDYELGLATESGQKLGYNYSGSANGKNLVRGDSTASNGYYITGLFYRGAYLQFEINAEEAVSGATLRVALSVEYAPITITSSTYRISVNGTNLSYSSISIAEGESMVTNAGLLTPFTEYYINSIDLEEGENIIKLTVNNNETPAGDAGTVDAASPAVDYIKVYSAAELSMTTYDGNY